MGEYETCKEQGALMFAAPQGFLLVIWYNFRHRK